MPHRRHTRLLLLLLLLLLPACRKAPESLVDVPRITPKEVVALLDAGKPVVIVDTRVPRQYERRRIPGAISIPARETEDHLDKLPPQATIALY
jgi:3-mercaptopyruvate sulfurtransferase SseA